MKRILTLLVLASIGFAATGCDPAPKDEPAATSSVTKTPNPPAKADAPAKPAS